MAEPETLTRAEILAGEIGDAILTGEFPPGSRLDELMLARRYDVSRTPVREALVHLYASKLIELRPRRGATVARVTRDQLDKMFIAMGEMEATCARLAAISMSPVERRRLQMLHDAMADLVHRGDPDVYAQANQNFHISIYAGAHNEVLYDFTAGLRRRLAPYRRAQFRVLNRLPRSHAEHAVVVSAILSGDAAAAHAAMQHHVSLVEDAVEAYALAASAA